MTEEEHLDGLTGVRRKNGENASQRGGQIWKGKNHSQFLLQQPSLNSLKEHAWKVQTSNKIRHFLWQALSGALAVNERLAHRQ